MTCSQIKNDYLHVFSTYNKEEICKHYLNGDILSIDANIVVVRNDKKLEFYDRQSDWSLIIQENDFENCISAFLNPNKKEFITLDSNGKLSLWNVEKSNKVYDFEFNCRPKYMLPSPDFQFFSILSENRIIILNLETKEHSEYNVDESKNFDL